MLVKCVCVDGHDGAELKKEEKGTCKSAASEMMQAEETKARSLPEHVRAGMVFNRKGSTEEKHHPHDCL